MMRNQPVIDQNAPQYRFRDVLGEVRNRSRRRINRTTVLCVATAILYALCWWSW